MKTEMEMETELRIVWVHRLKATGGNKLVRKTRADFVETVE